MAVMKVIDMLTQEDFHGAFEKFLERSNKCIAAGGDYFEVDKSFMCVLSININRERERERERGERERERKREREIKK